MEALTRLVSDSLARHGLDRPVDPRRLQWSRWFRCDSPHSLLVVPSKPGIFAIAEEIMDLTTTRGAADAGACPERPRAERGGAEWVRQQADGKTPLGGGAFQRCESQPQEGPALAAEVPSKRMLAVVQFSEDDNMAFVLDRMFTYVNPMRARLHAGSCFVRFVVVEDQQQRRSICAALNQWMRSSAEKATGLPAEFLSSIELASDHVARAPSPASRPEAKPVTPSSATVPIFAATQPDSGADKNLHCPQPFPSGF